MEMAKDPLCEIMGLDKPVMPALLKVLSCICLYMLQVAICDIKIWYEIEAITVRLMMDSFTNPYACMNHGNLVCWHI